MALYALCLTVIFELADSLRHHSGQGEFQSALIDVYFCNFMQKKSKGLKCHYCDCQNVSSCNRMPSGCLIMDWTALLHFNIKGSTICLPRVRREVHFFFERQLSKSVEPVWGCCTLSHTYTHTHARTRPQTYLYRMLGCRPPALSASRSRWNYCGHNQTWLLPYRSLSQSVHFFLSNWSPPFFYLHS